MSESEVTSDCRQDGSPQKDRQTTIFRFCQQGLRPVLLFAFYAALVHGVVVLGRGSKAEGVADVGSVPVHSPGLSAITEDALNRDKGWQKAQQVLIFPADVDTAEEAILLSSLRARARLIIAQKSEEQVAAGGKEVLEKPKGSNRKLLQDRGSGSSATGTTGGSVGTEEIHDGRVGGEVSVVVHEHERQGYEEPQPIGFARRRLLSAETSTAVTVVDSGGASASGPEAAESAKPVVAESGTPLIALVREGGAGGKGTQ